MDRSKIVVQQLHVPTRYLKRRWAVAEDPLEGENVAAVGEESPREAMAEDVRRAARRYARGKCEPADELLDRSRRQATASSADEERIQIDGAPTRDDPSSKRSSRTAADRDDTLFGALAHHATATFDQVNVANGKANKFPKPQPRVEQEDKKSPVAYGVTRAVGSLQ